MKTAKSNIRFVPFVVAAFLMSCSSNKEITSTNNLSDNKLVIIGMIEYDYSSLSNRNIKGIQVYLDSKEKVTNLDLSENFLPKKDLHDYEFIDFLGDKGNYDLCFRHRQIYSADADNLLTILDMERDPGAPAKNFLQHYTLNSGKIINLGRIVVTYHGGQVENSNISYTYSFQYLGSDTTALHAYKTTYPDLYEKYKDDMYIFRSDLEICLDYVIKNISESKALLIKDFIENKPDELSLVFNNLNAQNQDEMAKQIENYTIEELKYFLNEKSE